MSQKTETTPVPVDEAHDQPTQQEKTAGTIGAAATKDVEAGQKHKNGDTVNDSAENGVKAPGVEEAGTPNSEENEAEAEEENNEEEEEEEEEEVEEEEDDVDEEPRKAPAVGAKKNEHHKNGHQAKNGEQQVENGNTELNGKSRKRVSAVENDSATEEASKKKRTGAESEETEAENAPTAVAAE